MSTSPRYLKSGTNRGKFPGKESKNNCNLILITPGTGRHVGENEIELTTGSMSEVLKDFTADLALDGNLTSYAHTAASEFSWIRVEFREVSPVLYVKIINRFVCLL